MEQDCGNKEGNVTGRREEVGSKEERANASERRRGEVR